MRSFRGLAAVIASTAVLLAGTPTAQAEEHRPRPFQPSGTPITAAGKAEEAPVLPPGLHKDHLTPGEGSRYYRIQRTPGTGLSVALTWQQQSGRHEEIKAAIITPGGGNECAAIVGPSTSLPITGPLTLPLAVRGTEPGSSESIGSSVECARAPELLLVVERTDGDPVDVELMAMQEPLVEKAETLPAAETATATTAAPVEGETKDIFGGGSFTSAVEMEQGTYLDRMYPGDTAFYKVKVDYGQSATVTVESPAPDAGYQVDKDGYATTDVVAAIFSPGRLPVAGASSQVSLTDDRSNLMNLQVPEVRYLNQFESKEAGAFMGGHYYVQVTVASAGDAQLNRKEIPVRLRVKVNGEPQGQPAFQGEDPAKAAEAGAKGSETSSGSRLPWILAGGLGTVLLLGGLGYLAGTRSRRRTATDRPGSQRPAAPEGPDGPSEPGGLRGPGTPVAGSSPAHATRTTPPAHGEPTQQVTPGYSAQQPPSTGPRRRPTPPSAPQGPGAQQGPGTPPGESTVELPKEPPRSW